MTFQYVSVEDARQRDGLRMVVVGGVPSPWGEAAKGIFHVKGLEWVAVRLDYENEALKDWAGQRSGPVAFYRAERPRAGWAEILLLAERIAPLPALLPADPEERTLAFGLGHEMFGEAGLAWSRRLQMIDAGLREQGGFPMRAAQYLARKYGYSPEAGAACASRVASLLRMLGRRLQAQRRKGSDYYLGGGLTVVDIYSAVTVGMFAPLPEEHCAMDARTRKAFELNEPAVEAALDPILIEHRDMMYARHLELPLAL